MGRISLILSMCTSSISVYSPMTLGQVQARCDFFFSSRRRHTRYIGDWSSECALPILSDPLAIGVIGAGPWARMVTGPSLAAGPQTRVAGVWSRTEAHAAELAAQLSVPSFADLDALFDARSEERRVGKGCRSRVWRAAS